MSRLTPLVLLVIVGVLGWLVVRQTEVESIQEEPVQTPLFEGVEMRRVSAIRLESLTASRHLRFEKDAGNRWFLTDPVAWPVEKGLMDKIIQVVERNSAAQVPEVLEEDALGSFAPPRGFLETQETMEDGSTRKVRVEVGGLDLDGMRVWVRRDGQLYRTRRNLETLFTLNSADFRSKSLFSFSPNDINLIHRVGGWYVEGAQESLDLQMAPDGYGWRIFEPVKVLGDPLVLSLWSRFLSSLKAERFASDRPDVDLARYGLDAPWFSIHVTTGRGSTQTLHVSAKDDRVFAVREGNHTVYEIDQEDAVKLREPTGVFYESAFARIPRNQVRSITLRRPGAEMLISKEGEGWTIQERPEGMNEFSMALPADQTVVADLLSDAEEAEVLRYFTDVKVLEFFGPESQDRGMWIETFDDIRQGGFFAPPERTPQGTEIAMFWREGDSVVGSVSPEFAAQSQQPLTAFQDRQLWTLQNIRMRGLVIAREGAERRFKRTPADDWQPEDADIPARELDPVLDHLMFLKASSHVPEGERPALADLVTVTFVDGRGEKSIADIGVTEAGEAQVAIGPIRAVLKRQELHGDLMEIMDRKPDR